VTVVPLGCDEGQLSHEVFQDRKEEIEPHSQVCDVLWRTGLLISKILFVKGSNSKERVRGTFLFL
jgi:hypothetical protein